MGLDALPPGLFLWRALVQRVGGMQKFHAQSSHRSGKTGPRARRGRQVTKATEPPVTNETPAHSVPGELKNAIEECEHKAGVRGIRAMVTMLFNARPWRHLYALLKADGLHRNPAEWGRLMKWLLGTPGFL